jgi:hypothetical protein
MQFQFDGPIAVDPEIGAMFAALISEYIVLTDSEVSLAGDGRDQIDIDCSGFFLRVLLFAAEKGGFLSRKGKDGAHRLVIGLDFNEGELQIEEEGVFATS